MMHRFQGVSDGPLLFLQEHAEAAAAADMGDDATDYEQHDHEQQPEADEYDDDSYYAQQPEMQEEEGREQEEDEEVEEEDLDDGPPVIIGSTLNSSLNGSPALQSPPVSPSRLPPGVRGP